MISCKEATLLSLQREEHHLGAKKALQWYVHLAFCKFCRAFTRQSSWVNKTLGMPRLQPGLSKEEKDEMKQKLNS